MSPFISIIKLCLFRYIVVIVITVFGLVVKLCRIFKQTSYISSLKIIKKPTSMSCFYKAKRNIFF